MVVQGFLAARRFCCGRQEFYAAVYFGIPLVARGLLRREKEQQFIVAVLSFRSTVVPTSLITVSYCAPRELVVQILLIILAQGEKPLTY